MEWQLVGEDNWVFGEKVRGIVRYARGEIYCDPDHEEPDGTCACWRWMVLTEEQAHAHGGVTFLKGNKIVGGWEGKREWAIEKVEEALGVKDG